MEWTIKQIHNLSRPGESPKEGDRIQIELLAGYIMEVNPITRKSTGTPKVFVMKSEN